MTGKWTLRLLATAAAVLAGFVAFAGGARASNPYGPKVDDRLAKVLSRARPGQPIPVIVLRADRGVGGATALDNCGGEKCCDDASPRGFAGLFAPAKRCCDEAQPNDNGNCKPPGDEPPPSPPPPPPPPPGDNPPPPPPPPPPGPPAPPPPPGSDPPPVDPAPTSPQKTLDLVNAEAVAATPERVLELAEEPAVTFIAADVPVAPTGTRNERLSAARLRGRYPVVDRAVAAWARGTTGKGVGIAVVDSGVARVADFGSRVVRVRLRGQRGPLLDVHGHGSLVAGIAAGRGRDGRFVGIAPDAKIFAINVNRRGGPRSSDVIAALHWVFKNARRHNIRVVNLSVAETVTSTYRQSVLDLAVERLWAAGILVVVSSGNKGPGHVDYAPANDPLALTVGASDTGQTDSTRDDLVARFTSRGRTVDGFAKPELFAPGRLVASVLAPGTVLARLAPKKNRLARGYAAISGTSFAAPQVAGAAALVFQRHPSWSPDQVKWALLRYARSLRGARAARALDLAFVPRHRGKPGRANEGVPALVCPPGAKCTGDDGKSTVAARWSSAAWNASSWTASSWSASSWNAASWNSAGFNASSWNASSWNASSWNASSWNASSWAAFSWR